MGITTDRDPAHTTGGPLPLQASQLHSLLVTPHFRLRALGVEVDYDTSQPALKEADILASIYVDVDRLFDIDQTVPEVGCSCCGRSRRS